MDNRELLQAISERICGAHAKREEFIADIMAVVEKYPVDPRINYDFRKQPIQTNAQADSRT